ncbi:MAG TPA: type I asparaginase, partial [Bacteroidales bacterium]|nr:type I asparaginase [Bacteroidales bacterium]
SKILVIYTGGTIGMTIDRHSGAMVPFDFGNLYSSIPALEAFNLSIDIHSFDKLIDSSNVSPAFWVQLAKTVAQNYENYDGFVILHGTDTMAYSASMLSFMLENLNKPVIFTGSQLPMGVIRTDGRENFINAIEIASAKSDETPVVPEVAICFENRLFRGNRTSKLNAENFNAFYSGNYPMLAEIGVHIRYHHNAILRPNFKKLKVHTRLDPAVAVLKLFPGITEPVVKSVLASPGLKALILETFGSGNAPTDAWFIEALEEAILHRNLVIFNVTQCKGGAVEIGKYETSVELGRIGVIGGSDITTESAVTKLMFLLGQNLSDHQLRKLLQTSLRGEMTLQESNSD